MRAPLEFQGTVIGDLNRRKGMIVNSEAEGDDALIQAEVSPFPPQIVHFLSFEFPLLPT